MIQRHTWLLGCHLAMWQNISTTWPAMLHTRCFSNNSKSERRITRLFGEAPLPVSVAKYSGASPGCKQLMRPTIFQHMLARECVG